MANTSTTSINSSSDRFKPRLGRSLRKFGLLLILIALFAFACFLSPSFTNLFNLINISRQIALVGIVSIGMTLIILTKGIDLSVGSVVGIVSVVTAILLTSGVSIPATIVIGLLVGVLCGALNGLGVAWLGMPAFIVTLGTMVMGRGAALTLAGGNPLSIGPVAESFAFLGSGYILGIPVPVWIFAVLVLITVYVLNFTAFGRNVYAVGSNAEAARLAGINVKAVLFTVYTVTGFLAGLTGLIYVSRLTVGEPTEGTGLELEAIATVVIGGTSLFGGEGSVWGTVIGATILALLANILNLLGVSPFTQQIIKGAIIILTVMLETFRRNGRPRIFGR